MDDRSTRQMHRRNVLARLGLGVAAALAGAPAWAQPTGRVVKMVVGSPPAALGDVIARIMAEKFTEVTGSAAIVENRAGASGLFAADVVAKSAGDGATLLVAPDSVMVVNPLVFAKLPYDAVRDFRAVALLGKATLVLVANPTLGVKSMNDLVRLVQAKPDTLFYSSGGVGHVTHIGVELINEKLGLKIRHIPYKGTSPALAAVIGGEVGLMFLGVSGAMPQIKAGKLVPLAASGPAAKEVFPGLPLLQDFNQELDISVWFGIFASGQTPPQTVLRLNQTINTILQLPDLARKFSDFGITTQPGPAAALESLVKADTIRFGALIKALNITLE